MVSKTYRQAIAAAFLASTCLAPQASLAGSGLPASDGSSGSFDAQFTDAPDGPLMFNVDNGQVLAIIGGGWSPVFTVPYKTVSYNGQSLHAFEFTDIHMESPVHITVTGSAPGLFLAQTDISIAGQFLFSGTIGGAPSTGNAGDYNGGNGNGAGQSGGRGGIGQGGELQACGVSSTFSGSGGGGGGNYSVGTPGLRNFIPSNATPAPGYKGGPGGKPLNANKLLPGGAGAAGGGANSNGEYWGGPAGGNGGGVALFETPKTMTITSTGVLNVAGFNGGQQNYNSGSSGGGAGGDLWLTAKHGFSNAGQILANGGAGGTTQFQKYFCASHSAMIPGPNGGDGSGGVVRIGAPTITNTGTITVAGGGGSTNNGLLDTGGVAINNSGTILGNN